MDNLPVHIPKKLTNNLVNLFFPGEINETDKLELLISFKDKNISVRQLSAYLNFIDKAYGRLSPKGIIHYSRTSKYELKVFEIRHGSLDLIISNILHISPQCCPAHFLRAF